MVIIDTTSFFNDYDLASREWAEVLGLAEVGAAQVVVPRVVVREAARHYRREAARIDRTVISTLADSLKQLERVASVPRLDIRILRRS